MTAMSDYLENALLNHVFRNTAMTSPTTVYLALFLDDPTDADVGTEVSGGSYARQALAFNAPSGGEVELTSSVSFPAATADWGLVTHVGIYDAVSSGNLLVHGPMSSSTFVANGNTFSIQTLRIALL
jgi:hypothetical protein